MGLSDNRRERLGRSDPQLEAYRKYSLRHKQYYVSYVVTGKYSAMVIGLQSPLDSGYSASEVVFIYKAGMRIHERSHPTMAKKAAVKEKEVEKKALPKKKDDGEKIYRPRPGTIAEAIFGAMKKNEDITFEAMQKIATKVKPSTAFDKSHYAWYKNKFKQIKDRMD